MVYGGGLAVGTGLLARALKNMPLKKGLNKNVGKGLEWLALHPQAADHEGKRTLIYLF